MRYASLTSLLLCIFAVLGAWLLRGSLAGGGDVGLAGALAQPLGLGLLSGTLLGASLSGFGIVIQTHIAAERPQLLVPGLAVAFGVKFLVLVAAAGCFLIWPSLGERVHPVATLLAYAASAFLVLMAGTVETARWLARQDPTRAASLRTPAS